MNQPTLFESKTDAARTEDVLLYALGEFQARGFVLAERKLPLDRLLGAFKRAAEHFKVSELTDEQIAGSLEKLGAKIDKVPSYVAKHPFRVTVSTETSERARGFYDKIEQKISASGQGEKL